MLGPVDSVRLEYLKGLSQFLPFSSIFDSLANRAEVRSSFLTTTVREESQVTPQGRHQ